MRLAFGDDVIIERVESDRGDISEGGTYVVQGRYVLRSEPAAMLNLFITNGDGETSPAQLRVERGTGTFEFRTVLLRFGFPHVSFYPIGGGECLGGTYFGRGATLYAGG